MKYSEVLHFSHPQHKLRFDFSETPFKCDGCKEAGIGTRYKCLTCDFDLHIHCAIPSPVIHHPFYTKCTFQFLARPAGEKARYCNACERDILGFVYHCKDCGFDLHPCCAKLPVRLDDGEVELYLYRKVSASCHKCGRKGKSWSYRSKCKNYNLHVACVKDLLVESWHELYSARPKGRKVESVHEAKSVNGFDGRRKMEMMKIPSLKNTLQDYHGKKKGKVQACCQMAGVAVQFVISAVLGDPTALIAGVIGSLIRG